MSISTLPVQSTVPCRRSILELPAFDQDEKLIVRRRDILQADRFRGLSSSSWSEPLSTRAPAQPGPRTQSASVGDSRRRDLSRDHPNSSSNSSVIVMLWIQLVTASSATIFENKTVLLVIISGKMVFLHRPLVEVVTFSYTPRSRKYFNSCSRA